MCFFWTPLSNGPVITGMWNLFALWLLLVAWVLSIECIPIRTYLVLVKYYAHNCWHGTTFTNNASCVGIGGRRAAVYHYGFLIILVKGNLSLRRFVEFSQISMVLKYISLNIWTEWFTTLLFFDLSISIFHHCERNKGANHEREPLSTTNSAFTTIYLLNSHHFMMCLHKFKQ